MARIKLGGMSISGGHSQLRVTCTNAGNALSDVCSSLGANRINITLLTHLAEDGRETCSTAPCLESSNGFLGCFLLKRGQGAIETVTMQADLCILSVFPHDRRPGVTGALLELLARLEVFPLGVASSPSSISVLIPYPSVEKVVFGLFETFEFPPTKSPADWSPESRGQEGLLREIRCSYEERVIKVCNFSRQSELDFWSVSLPPSQMGPTRGGFHLHGRPRYGAFLHNGPGTDWRVPAVRFLPGERAERRDRGGACDAFALRRL